MNGVPQWLRKDLAAASDAQLEEAFGAMSVASDTLDSAPDGAWWMQVQDAGETCLREVHGVTVHGFDLMQAWTYWKEAKA